MLLQLNRCALYRLSRLLGIFAAGILLAAQANAAPAPATGSIPHAQVALVSEDVAAPAQGDFWLGLHFTLEPGWHIYWTNPGDSGEAPKVIWHLPQGVSAGAIDWPVPARLPTSGLMDFGYTGAVTLLVPMHASAGLKPGTPAAFGADLKVFICRELCIAGQTQLSLSVPVETGSAPQASPATKALFAAARGRLPEPAPKNWITHVTEGKTGFVLNVATGKPASSASFFPLDQDQIDNAAPQPVQATAKGFQMQLRKSDALTKPVSELRGVLVIGGKGYTLDAPVSAIPSKSKS